MNSVAAGKVVLHAVKFAHAEVCGVLLGRASEDRDAPVLVEDAIPFFHKSENKNSPIMEVALAQVSWGGSRGSGAMRARFRGRAISPEPPPGDLSPTTTFADRRPLSSLRFDCSVAI